MSKTTKKKYDYPLIRAWGHEMGSYQYYIDMQISKAREANAPQDAAFFDDQKNEWVTVDNMNNPFYRRKLKGIYEEWLAKAS